MTNKQILEKAIKKAHKNGWVQPTVYLEEAIDMYVTEEVSPLELIFSHDFAKAYFKEDWKIKLQEMVLESDPIKFLQKYL